MYRRENLWNLLRAHKRQSLKRPFFCLKCSIGYTRYGRSGRAASRWPFSEYGILTPVRSATITVRSDGGRFVKNLLRVSNMKNSIHERGLAKQRFARAQDKSYARIQEHTAIYSLTTYNQRIRQLQRQKRLKILFDCMGYFCICFITFSLLFLGE